MTAATRCVLLAVATLAWLPAGTTRADDVRVDADTTLQAYDVQSPASPVVWARRRLTQTLGLRYVKSLDPETTRVPAPSLQLYVGLRLDQDFGSTCVPPQSLCFAIVNPERRGSYTPVVSQGGLDLPSAYLEARDLPHASQLRLGRQLYVDEVGFLRVDGLSARAAPQPWVAFDAAAGTLVRRTSVAGADAFHSGSVLYLGLEQAERERVRYPVHDVTTWLASLSCELGSEQLLRARITARVLHEAGGFVEQRVGAGLASRVSERMRLDAHGVFDLFEPGLIDSEVGAQLDARPWTAQLRLERHLPRFEPSTIWAYFDVTPLWLATLSTQWTPSEGILTSLGLRGRRSDFGGGDTEHDLGVDAALSLFNARDSLTIAGFGWVAERGPLWGASLGGSRRLTYVITLEAEVSLFRVDDRLSDSLRGISLQELLGLRFIVTEDSEVRLMATHTYGEAADHRLSLLFFLHLGAWR